MSIKVQSYVWENSKASGSALLLLLAIADHAHDDGTGAYPGIDLLAHKCRQSVRNTDYLLRKLEKMGEIITMPNGGPKGTNEYRIPMEGVQTLQVQNGDEIPRQIAPEPPVIVNNHNSTVSAKPAEPTNKVQFVPKSIIDSEDTGDSKKKKFPPQTPLALYLQENADFRGSKWEGFKTLKQRVEWEELESAHTSDMKSAIDWSIGKSLSKGVIVERIMTATRNKGTTKSLKPIEVVL